jgi:hypothetical protein
VIPAEQDEKYAYSWRQQEKTIFGERVGVHETATIAHTDLVLACLIMPVQRGKVNIR